ncbi:TetR/AcrR family transcriptional regulator (plasmid) [Serratia sp. AXJ-M]|uniref:TetR/AcrR family transcriptional regulator n=1 Tax=Serratia sp. AXJ-M TaxID=2754727 RepID=UPI00397CD390
MAISSAAQKISDAAVLHFAEKGFDAGSLNAVAEMAGIKKATIYSHFKNKDELFIYVFEEAIAVESVFALQCFSRDRHVGECYLAQVTQRYQNSGHLRLLLRTAFIPPEGVREQVASGYEKFLAQLKSKFLAGLVDKDDKDMSMLAEAYLGIVDSVHVELLYATPVAAEIRRRSLWKLLSEAM